MLAWTIIINYIVINSDLSKTYGIERNFIFLNVIYILSIKKIEYLYADSTYRMK